MSHSHRQTHTPAPIDQQPILPPELEAKLRKLANLLIDRILEEHQQIYSGQSTKDELM